MALYNPDSIPTQAEIDFVVAQIEAMTGTPIAASDKAAIVGFTRKQVAEYIKGII